MKMKKTMRLILCMAASLLLGGLTHWLAGDAVGIYRNLYGHPPFSPPVLLFVLLMPLSALLNGAVMGMLWNRKTKRKRPAFWYYLAHILLALLSFVVFFRFGFFKAGAVLLIFCTMVLTYAVYQLFHFDGNLACLTVPYFLWMIFLCYLSVGITILN